MAIQEPTAAPELFVRLLRKNIAASGLSLREIGRQAGVSTAYMSRLVNKQRGLPADETIIRLEEVLDIQPRGQLFDTAVIVIPRDPKVFIVGYLHFLVPLKRLKQ